MQIMSNTPTATFAFPCSPIFSTVAGRRQYLFYPTVLSRLVWFFNDFLIPLYWFSSTVSLEVVYTQPANSSSQAVRHVRRSQGLLELVNKLKSLLDLKLG